MMLIPLVFLTVLTFLAGFLAFDQVGDALGFPGGINPWVFFPEPEAFHFNDTIAGVTGLISLLGFFTAYWLFWGRNARRAVAFARAFDATTAVFPWPAPYGTKVGGERSSAGPAGDTSSFITSMVSVTAITGSASSKTKPRTSRRAAVPRNELTH